MGDSGGGGGVVTAGVVEEKLRWEIAGDAGRLNPLGKFDKWSRTLIFHCH